MAITYTEERYFTPQQVADLFLSVRWVVGKYPDRLHKALMNSSRVISAWNDDRLVGLIRVMDDSELVCFINYVLVHPDYQGHGIAGHLLEMVKDAYKSYLYINVMIGDSTNAPFYEKHGFKVKESSLPMQYRNVPKYTKKQNRKGYTSLVECVAFIYCLQTGSRRSRESLNHPLCGCGNESYTKKSPCLSIMQVFKPHYMQKKGDFIWQQRHRALRTQNGYANTTQYLHLSIDVKLYIINTEIVYVKY